jgi:hypothetical protein
MRRTFSRALVIGAAVLGLATPVVATAAPASAGTGTCSATCVAGHYAVHYKWGAGARWSTFQLDLAADHTGSFVKEGATVVWSKGHGTFTMKFDGGTVTGTYVGYRNEHGGFCFRKRPGTMSNNVGDSGVWWAEPAPAAD